jgi:hypothetical protein
MHSRRASLLHVISEATSNTHCIQTANEQQEVVEQARQCYRVAAQLPVIHGTK